MLCSGHGCEGERGGRKAKLLALLLGLLLWWPIVPEAATFAHAVHAVVTRADVDGGAVGWSEQAPLASSERNEAEDFESKHTAPNPACSCAPAHLLEHGWTRTAIVADVCVSVPPSHERLGRQRGPPIS